MAAGPACSWVPGAGGKSGLRRTGWSVTPTGRKARESATESKPPCGVRNGSRGVRVKRCGKSAPAGGATRLARQTPPGARPSREEAVRQRRCGSVRPASDSRVGCLRCRATGILEKWPSPWTDALRSGNRTRLTGPLRDHFVRRRARHRLWQEEPSFVGRSPDVSPPARLAHRRSPPGGHTLVVLVLGCLRSLAVAEKAQGIRSPVPRV